MVLLRKRRRARRRLLEPLIAHRWPRLRSPFPAHQRRIDEPYRTITSERLDAAVRGNARRRDRQGERFVGDPDQRHARRRPHLVGRAILDARGLTATPPGLDCGWQFVGQSLEIPAGHGLARPIVMDATVDQSDGYRFVYCLPLSPTRLFVEDTYYSTRPDLDLHRSRGAHRPYARLAGWTVSAVTRDESGVPPVVTGGDFRHFLARHRCARPRRSARRPVPPADQLLAPRRSTLRSALARARPRRQTSAPPLAPFAHAHWRAWLPDRLLARMLFKAAEPARRFKILERFYRSPPR